MQDNRTVHQQQNVLQDNRHVSVEQKIVQLLQGGTGASSSSSSGSGPPGGGGGGGGGGGARPRALGPIPEDITIGDELKQPEKRAALAIEDKKKKKKTNTPDIPIALPDRAGQAKRKIDIPKEAPDEKVKKLGRQLVKVLARKAFRATPHIVDIGEEPPLPPPFDPPPRAAGPPRSRAVMLKGKGRRLVDNDEPIANPTIPVKVSSKTKRKPGGVSGRARTQRFGQLALMPVD